MCVWWLCACVFGGCGCVLVSLVAVCFCVWWLCVCVFGGCGCSSGRAGARVILHLLAHPPYLLSLPGILSLPGTSTPSPSSHFLVQAVRTLHPTSPSGRRCEGGVVSQRAGIVDGAILGRLPPPHLCSVPVWTQPERHRSGQRYCGGPIEAEPQPWPCGQWRTGDP